MVLQLIIIIILRRFLTCRNTTVQLVQKLQFQFGFLLEDREAKKEVKDHLHSVLKQCYTCTQTRIIGCLSFILAFHLSRCCCVLRSSADWSTSTPTTESPSSPGWCPSSCGHWCYLSYLQPSLRLRLGTAQSHAVTQPYIRSWGRHRRHRRTTTTNTII